MDAALAPCPNCAGTGLQAIPDGDFRDLYRNGPLMDVECPLCGGRGQVAARPVEPLRYRIAPGGCA